MPPTAPSARRERAASAAAATVAATSMTGPMKTTSATRTALNGRNLGLRTTSFMASHPGLFEDCLT